MSKALGWLNADDYERIKRLIEKSGLPINPPDISEEKFLDLMQLDKKTKNNQIHLVLQTSIGRAIVTHDYDAKVLSQTLLHKIF
jgi:3-dehydroquinate synthase